MLIEFYDNFQAKTGNQRPDFRMDPTFMEYLQQLKGHLKDGSDVSRLTEEELSFYIGLKVKQQNEGNCHECGNHCHAWQ